MMAAVQPCVSGAISKTVNLPNAATVEDDSDIKRLGWELGLKANAIYREGSKRTQPLTTSDGTVAAAVATPEEIAAPVRRRLPDDRAAMTHKFSVGGQEGYITVGLYDDGSPGEVFVKMSKQGSTVSGLMDSVAIAWSMALQHGVPVESLIAKYIDHRFEPSGFTGNPRIPMARSVVDYLARWMASKFLSEEDQRIAGVLPGVEPSEPLVLDEPDETPEDQLSFGQVSESNGNGNAHALEEAAKPRAALGGVFGRDRQEKLRVLVALRDPVVRGLRDRHRRRARRRSGGGRGRRRRGWSGRAATSQRQRREDERAREGAPDMLEPACS
jgi:ribonucleoside-diphosphate reductase alpha chain